MRLATKILPLIAVLNGAMNAQFFYDGARDKTAQEAEAAARQIAAGTLFEKELRNADALSKLQIAAQISISRKAYLTVLDSFKTWEDVSKQLASVKEALKEQPRMTHEQRKARLEEISAKQTELKNAIAALKRPEHKGTLVEAILDRLDQGESLVAFAKGLESSGNKKADEAIGHVEAALAVAKSLFDSWKSTLGGLRAIEAGLADLAIPPEVLEAELLRLEEQYLNQLGIIAARQELESGEVLQLISEAEGQAKSLKGDIEQSLRDAKGDRGVLGFRLHILHTVAAIAMRNELPANLAKLRDTQETLRHAIRQDAATARSHEQLLLASSQRLAMYYKGGIKPGQLAQLLYSISGLVSLPIIAAK